MKPTMEEITQAYKEFKTVSKELDIAAWDRQLKAHKGGKGEHPQELRRKNVRIFNEARAKFFGIMNLLVEEEGKTP